MAKGLKDLLTEAKARITEISTAQAEAVHERGDATLFLDVREPGEFAKSHIAGALLIPRGTLEPKAAADSPARDSQLSDPSRPIIAYCGSGARSAFAAQTLQELGFTNVQSMAGGFQAWEAESRPVQD
jgi:rhodanese-related sulfurtransferase